MQIIVDDQAYAAASGVSQTVGELAAEIGRSVPGERRLVVQVSCDGQAVEGVELEQTLARPAGDFAVLEFRTQPVGALVRNILEETLGLFDEADEARRQAAVLISAGQTEKAMEQLQRFFELWRQVQQAMILSAQALGEDLDGLEVGGKPLAEVFEPLKKLLGELKEAMSGQDYVVAGDLLGYEFDEPMKDWRGLLDQIRERAAGA